MNVPTGHDYRPNAEVLKRLSTVTFVGVIGPTGVGKSTLMGAAAARDKRFHMVHNNTSRPPREHEREGQEFHFATRQEMESRILRGEFVQVAPSVFGDLYGTAAEDYSPTGVSMLPALADVMPILRALPFKAVRSIFVLPPDYDTWQQRFARHGFSAEQLQRRMREAERSLLYALEDEDTKLVISHQIETSAQDFMLLALGKPLTARLQADQSHGRAIADDLLVKLRALL